ncbi:hypothetical protein D3C76_1205370 [compost metagenome]
MQVFCNGFAHFYKKPAKVQFFPPNMAEYELRIEKSCIFAGIILGGTIRLKKTALLQEFHRFLCKQC